MRFINFSAGTPTNPKIRHSDIFQNTIPYKHYPYPSHDAWPNRIASEMPVTLYTVIGGKAMVETRGGGACAHGASTIGKPSFFIPRSLIGFPSTE